MAGKRRHPAQVTAARLRNHYEDLYDYMDGLERDQLSQLADVLEQIANGEREKFDDLD